MAFKPVTMEDSRVCVSIADPAIDRENSDVLKYEEKWLKEGAALSEHIKAKDGESLTEFTVGVVPPDELAKISDDCLVLNGNVRNEEAQWRCFLWGLRDIRNMGVEAPKVKRGSIEYVDPLWLKKTFVRGLRKIALGIGLKVWFFNQMTEDEVKN